MTIKFNKFFVACGKEKVRVWYTSNVDYKTGQPCIFINQKDYGYELTKIFPNETKNDTDIMTDYFDKCTTKIFPSNQYYKELLDKIEQWKIEENEKRAKTYQAIKMNQQI